jgi:hypothetical protein
MVKLKSMQVVNQNGRPVPVMHVHPLECLKPAPTFNVGETVLCYIAKYDNNRYAVFSSSGYKETKYHVFESEQELHEHFQEN